MKRAPFFIRLLAFLVDLGFLFFVSLLLFISGLAGYSMGMEPVQSFSSFLFELRHFFPLFFKFLLILFLFYFTYLTARGEKTIGKTIFGIKVVRRRDSADIGIMRSFLRALFYWVSAFPFFVGFLMAFLLKGRALHDILTGTMVVKEE